MAKITFTKGKKPMLEVSEDKSGSGLTGQQAVKKFNKLRKTQIILIKGQV